MCRTRYKQRDAYDRCRRRTYARGHQAPTASRRIRRPWLDYNKRSQGKSCLLPPVRDMSSRPEAPRQGHRELVAEPPAPATVSQTPPRAQRQPFTAEVASQGQQSPAAEVPGTPRVPLQQAKTAAKVQVPSTPKQSTPRVLATTTPRVQAPSQAASPIPMERPRQAPEPSSTPAAPIPTSRAGRNLIRPRRLEDSVPK